jgi:hypothetical protein
MKPLGRRDERVRQRAGGLTAEDLEVLAKVVSAGAAVEAAVVDQVRLEQDRIAHSEAINPRTDGIDDSRCFVSRHNRKIDERVLSREGVKVRAADADRLRSDAQFTGTGLGHRAVLDPHLPGRRKHDLTHANLLTLLWLLPTTDRPKRTAT